MLNLFRQEVREILGAPLETAILAGFLIVGLLDEIAFNDRDDLCDDKRFTAERDSDGPATDDTFLAPGVALQEAPGAIPVRFGCRFDSRSHTYCKMLRDAKKRKTLQTAIICSGVLC